LDNIMNFFASIFSKCGGITFTAVKCINWKWVT